MRRSLSKLWTLLAVALVAAAGASAQAPVVWESMPTTRDPEFGGSRTDGLAISAQADGSYDIYVHSYDINRFDPTAQDWVRACRGGTCLSTALLARDSIVIGGAASRASRSGDYGVTWTHDAPTSLTSLVWGANPNSDGAVLANRGFTLYRSDDRGLTYTELGAFGGWTHDIAEVPASASLPDGRILAALDNGITYSDDGGLSFERSGLFELGNYIGNSLTFAPEAGHPYGGAVYASVSVRTSAQRGRAGGIFRSDDGGLTWREVLRTLEGDYGLEDPDRAQVRGAADGSLWVGLISRGGGLDKGAMLVSRDGGESFTEEGTGWGGFSPNAVRIAPDGRVYAATDSLVWRTTRSVVVSQQPEPPEASGALLEISPNPASGAVRIALELDTPEAATLRVYDARGREVWASGAGPVRGQHTWEADTSAWATGVYVARVEAGGEAARQSFTVAR